MDELRTLLGGKWQEPPEIKVIKDFVREHYQSSVSVSVRPSHIVINAPNVALAATLRLNIEELKRTLKTDKRLAIHIGD